MQIKIRETGNIEDLNLYDTRTGQNSIMDLIGNTGSLEDGTFSYDEDHNLYVVSQDDYDWWKEVVNNEQELDELIYDLKINKGYDVEKAMQNAPETDLEDQAKATIQHLKEEFEIETV